jgi:hypothetical protein
MEETLDERKTQIHSNVSAHRQKTHKKGEVERERERMRENERERLWGMPG